MSEQRTETDRLEQPAQNTTVAPEANDAEDVPQVIEDHTGDGPGDEDPGESDFVGYEDPSVMEEGLQ